MMTFLLIPLFCTTAYSLIELRNARRRERRLWAVIAEMAERVDDVSVEIGLLDPGRPVERARPGAATVAGPAARPVLRTVNGGG